MLILSFFNSTVLSKLQGTYCYMIELKVKIKILS